MITLESRAPSETRDFGASLGRLLRPGDVVLLAGDLGSGKTTLVQGVGAALGVDRPMPSPTFTLMNIYRADLLLAHIDLWRLEQLAELADLGLEELLDDGAVALIEWGDVALPLYGHDALLVRLASGASPEERRIEVEALGPSFEGRLERLGVRS